MFGEFGVTQASIEKRIQRRMDAITPALVVQLGKIYNSLKDGMSNAAEWFEAVPESELKTETPKRGAAGLKEAATKAKPAADNGFTLDGNATPPTYAAIAEKIDAAKTTDELDLVADLARGLVDETQRAEADVEIRAKRKALDKS